LLYVLLHKGTKQIGKRRTLFAISPNL